MTAMWEIKWLEGDIGGKDTIVMVPGTIVGTQGVLNECFG